MSPNVGRRRDKDQRKRRKEKENGSDPKPGKEKCHKQNQLIK